jgi:hypothetical protein
MGLDERVITRAIVEKWHQKFQESLDELIHERL